MRSFRFAMLLIVLGSLPLTSAHSQTWQWAIQPIGLAGTDFKDNAATSVAIDHSGNSFIVGQFDDSASFGTVLMKSMNVLDMYIAKLSPIGTLDWVRTIGGPYDEDKGIDVTVDPQGNAYMCGFFGDSLFFDGALVTAAGQSSVALAKYDTDGNLQWAKLAAGLTIGSEGGIDYSPTGHIYLGCGHTLGKYTLDGDTVWTRPVPVGFNTFSINDVAVNENGQYIYVTGQFSDSVDVGGIMLGTSSISDVDILIAKYDQDGNIIWAKQAGSTTGIFPEAGNGIAVDHNDNAYVCGQFNAVAHFDADSVSSNLAPWGMFLAKYDPAGSLDWVLGGSGTSSIYSSSATDVRLVSDESAVLVAGYFNGSVLFGGTTFSLFSGSDALLVKVRDSGSLLWGEQSGSSTAIITVKGMDVDRTTSNAVVVGSYTSAAAAFVPFLFPDPFPANANAFIVSTTTESPTPVASDQDVVLPTSLKLAQNFPNPFNPTTTIKYDIPSSEHVNVTIYDVLGRRVRQLLDADEPVGDYQIEWNGRDDNDKQVASGVYFYRLKAGQQELSKKMVLLK